MFPSARSAFDAVAWKRTMIYGFARQSGGQDRIHSAVGVGITMRIDLPRFAGTVEAGARKEEQTTVPRARDGETVLVIDDEGATVGAFGRRTSASRRSACNP
jgi:hypothetical protein